MNALSKELSCSAIFVETARELWVDLKDHFSQINGPRIFQIQSDINSISPGNKSISSYFTRLKTLWDELNLYNPLPIYSCGTVKILDDYQQRTHTIQFLMGLNDTHLFVAIFFSWTHSHCQQGLFTSLAIGKATIHCCSTTTIQCCRAYGKNRKFFS